MEKKPVILVVDDDVPIQILMQSILREFGFQSLVAGTGAEAVDLIESGNRPDLVLLDMNMPGMSGPDAVRELRKRLAGVPIIILSGERLGPDETLRLGATASVQKPFDVAELVARIRESVA